MLLIYMLIYCYNLYRIAKQLKHVSLPKLYGALTPYVTHRLLASRVQEPNFFAIGE